MHMILSYHIDLHSILTYILQQQKTTADGCAMNHNPHEMNPVHLQYIKVEFSS